MPIEEWAYLASRGGEAIESFIAILLRRKYPDAQQMTPSRGDGGIDIFRRTPEGLIVYQIKKFTTALTSSQWSQVKDSWATFWTEQVEPGEKISAYHLVTPWTPTAPRYKDFATLTEAASFPAQWEGSAFIDGLADEFPDSYARFAYGPGALERFVNAKAVLAATPLSDAEQTSFLDSVQTREDALDQLRNLASDFYYIDSGRRTTASPDDYPMPPPGDRGVYYRFTPEGNGRYSYITLVPRPDAPPTNPMRLKVDFHVEPGSSEAAAVEEWTLWGTPFTDIPATTTHVGGPFDGERYENAMLDFVVVHDVARLPDMVLRVLAHDGSEKGTLHFRTKAVTQGAVTNWLRVVLVSAGGLLELEVRRATDDQYSRAEHRVPRLDGLSPTGVLADHAVLSRIEPDDTVEVGIEYGPLFFTSTAWSRPDLIPYAGRVASALTSLQPSTNQVILMPEVEEGTLEQIGEAEHFASIYSGIPLQTTWTEFPLTIPDPPSEVVSKIQNGGPITVETCPQFSIANREFVIDRPLEYVLATIKFTDADANLEPGSQVSVSAGQDSQVVVTAVTDWTPSTPQPR